MPLNGNKRKAHPPGHSGCHNALNAVFIPAAEKRGAAGESVEPENKFELSFLPIERSLQNLLTYEPFSFLSSFFFFFFFILLAPAHSGRITVLRLIVERVCVYHCRISRPRRRNLEGRFACSPVTQSPYRNRGPRLWVK